MITTNFEDHDAKQLALDNPTALALAVLQERISTLPDLDRQDLIDLLPDFFSNDEESRQSAVDAASEILGPKPRGKIIPLKEGDGDLSSWMSFVSAKLKSERKKAQFTQEELAQKAGIPQSHISRLENAAHSATSKTLLKIAKALGIPLSTFDPSAD